MFIKLHRTTNESKQMFSSSIDGQTKTIIGVRIGDYDPLVFVNMDFIESVRKADDCTLVVTSESSYTVTESVPEVMEKIADAEKRNAS